MIIQTKVCYPPDKAQEIAKIFLEAPKAPGYMVRNGPFVNAATEDGINVMSFFELENEKLADGLQFLGTYMASFFSVEGFRYEIKPWFNVDEALKMIGM